MTRFYRVFRDFLILLLHGFSELTLFYILDFLLLLLDLVGLKGWVRLHLELVVWVSIF